MIKKLLVLLVLSAVLISGCFIEKFGYEAPSDCKENQYYDASVSKCKKIINECYTDEDCPGYKTCERRVIRTHMACKVGEECPTWYHNVCELTEETIKHCDKDSDCGIQFTCCCFEALNKKYITEVTCDMEDVLCSPCPWSEEDASVKCINQQCRLVSKETSTEEQEEGDGRDREILIVDLSKEITSEELLQKLNDNDVLKIDSRVIEELEKSLKVRVYVQHIDNLLKDTNISLYEDFDEKNKIESNYYSKFYESITANLSEDDFKVRHVFSHDPDFSGYLTKSGLEKLKKDERVTRISLVERTSVTNQIDNENISESEEDSSIYDLGDYKIILNDIAVMFNGEEKEDLIALSVLNRTLKD